MKRRNFLLFKTEGSEKLVELSCEKLFMHFEDARSEDNQGVEEAGTFAEADWWSGEPPLLIDNLDPDEYFRSVESELILADVVQVIDPQWLVQGEFQIRVDTLLAAIRARGKQVRYALKESNPTVLTPKEATTEI